MSERVKGSKDRCFLVFIRTKHSMQIVRVVPFIKLQNDTSTS